MSEKRKKDHIELTNSSQVRDEQNIGLEYLNYEPLLSEHVNKDYKMRFLGKEVHYPFWVSSMTGGTGFAKKINTRLAKCCNKFGLGMGLGSCRPLLESRERFDDFAMRSHIGDFPLYANLGIAQIEDLVLQNKTHKITELLKSLEVDGLVIHVNPLQEALQTNGDRFKLPPFETLSRLMEKLELSYIVKEVGQGMGPKSLEKLFSLPIKAIELSGFGGTNFTYLEYLRSKKTASDQIPSENMSASKVRNPLEEFAYIGHSAKEMVGMVNNILDKKLKETNKHSVELIIISGGIKSLIKGHELRELLHLPSVLGFASTYLNAAIAGEDELFDLIEKQVEALNLCHSYLRA